MVGNFRLEGVQVAEAVAAASENGRIARLEGRLNPTQVEIQALAFAFAHNHYWWWQLHVSVYQAVPFSPLTVASGDSGTTSELWESWFGSENEMLHMIVADKQRSLREDVARWTASYKLNKPRHVNRKRRRPRRRRKAML